MPYPDEREVHLPGGIILNGPRDADGVLYTCATLDGWGSPGGTGGGQQRVGAHGGTAPRQWLTPRSVTATGLIKAPSQLLRQQAELKLKAAIGLDLFDFTVVDAIPLTCLARRGGQISLTDDTDVRTTWQAELEVPDPRLYGVDTKTLLMGLPLTTGGNSWPGESWPEMFLGSTQSGDDSAINEGTITAPLKVTFTGPLEVPQAINVDTGQSVAYASTLAAGEFVDIYMSTPMVALLMGTADRTGYVSTSGGGPWGLAPGANHIAFRAASGTGTALLEWRDTYE